MSKILIIAEKRDQAQKVSDAMGWQKGAGCWQGKFEGKDVVLVCARGHLITNLEPDEVMPGINWSEPHKYIPLPREHPIKAMPDMLGDDKKPLPKHLQASSYLSNINKHLKGASEVIISTDSDREGESIGWTILDYLKYSGPVRRAWLAAGLDKKSITDAMSSLRSPEITKSYHRAAEARRWSDWNYQLIVRTYSHFGSFSCFGKNLGRGSGGSSVVSVGRVQTPTLSMIIERDLEIENFVSQDYFSISGEFKPDGTNNSLLANYSPIYNEETIEKNTPGVSWVTSKKQATESDPEPIDTPLFTGKKEVEEFKERLLNSDNGFISKYSESTRNEAPPKTFALTDGVAALIKGLRVNGDLAQVILEDLYEQGWTSYARTSKAEIPQNLYIDSERNSMLNSIMSLPEITEQAKEVQLIHNGNHPSINKFKPAIFVNKSMEHYGIIPTSQKMTVASFNSLAPKKKEGKLIKHTKQNMQDAYIIIAKQFIQVLYPPAKYATQTIEFTVPVMDILGNNSSLFKSKGERTIDLGWRSAFGNGEGKDTSVPVQKKGNKAQVINVNLKSQKTTPPARFNSGTLQKRMETISKFVKDPKLKLRLKESEGIGTPATRKDVIKTLISREYIKEIKGSLISQPKGRDLMRFIPEWLRNAETTALWEDYLVKICNERNDAAAITMRDEFVEKQTIRSEKLIQALMDKFNNNLGEKIERTQSKVTSKMKELIKKIEKSKNIKAPKGAMSIGNIAVEFLNAHIEKRDPNKIYPPSSAQIKFLDSIINNLPEGTVIPEGIKEDSNICKEFINKNVKKKPPAKKEIARLPSEKQIQLANKLIAKLEKGKVAPPNVLKDANVCSKFISDVFAKKY